MFHSTGGTGSSTPRYSTWCGWKRKKMSTHGISVWRSHVLPLPLNLSWRTGRSFQDCLHGSGLVLSGCLLVIYLLCLSVFSTLNSHPKQKFYCIGVQIFWPLWNHARAASLPSLVWALLKPCAGSFWPAVSRLNFLVVALFSPISVRFNKPFNISSWWGYLAL